MSVVLVPIQKNNNFEVHFSSALFRMVGARSARAPFNLIRMCGQFKMHLELIQTSWLVPAKASNVDELASFITDRCHM